MMLLMSSPALALNRDDGDDPGTGLSVIETLGLYVLLPVGLFAVIAGLVMALDKSHQKKDPTSSNIRTEAESRPDSARSSERPAHAVPKGAGPMPRPSAQLRGGRRARRPVARGNFRSRSRAAPPAQGPGMKEGAPGRATGRPVDTACYADAAASAACARRARSTPARDSETRRRRAALGSAEVSQASVRSRVSPETWTPG